MKNLTDTHRWVFADLAKGGPQGVSPSILGRRLAEHLSDGSGEPVSKQCRQICEELVGFGLVVEGEEGRYALRPGVGFDDATLLPIAACAIHQTPGVPATASEFYQVRCSTVGCQALCREASRAESIIRWNELQAPT